MKTLPGYFLSAALLVLFAGFGLSTAEAANSGEICGTTIDEDASGGDLACASPDADRDEYWTNGLGPNSGTDCDDTDRFIFPGEYKDAGSGNIQLCQSNGTFATATSRSAYTCHTGSGATIWFDFTAGANTNAGTFASPKKDYIAFSNTGAAGYRAPVAGDCYVFIDNGTYNSTWSDAGTTRQAYLNNKDGTSTDKITIRSAPGQRATIAGAGTSPTEVWPVHLVDSNYIVVKQLLISGGYSNAGIYFNGGTNYEAAANKVTGIRGNSANNVGCIKASSGSHNGSIHHNVLTGCFDSVSPLGSGNNGIVIFNNDNIAINDNVVDNANGTAATGVGVHMKTGSPNGGTLYRNVIMNTNLSGIWTGQGNFLMKGNVLSSVAEAATDMALKYSRDNNAYFSGSTFEYNTIINSPFFEFNPDTTDAAIGNPALTVRNNVVVDDNGFYSGDGTKGFVRIHYYGSDALYTDVITGNKLTIDRNCYYNSVPINLYFTIFGDAGSGASGANYSTWSSWQSTSPNSYDDNSFNENPAYNSYHIATSSNCSNKGWNNAFPAASSGSRMPGIVKKKKKSPKATLQ